MIWMIRSIRYINIIGIFHPQKYYKVASQRNLRYSFPEKKQYLLNYHSFFMMLLIVYLNLFLLCMAPLLDLIRNLFKILQYS